MSKATLILLVIATLALVTTACAPKRCDFTPSGRQVCWRYPERQLTPVELEDRWQALAAQREAGRQQSERGFERAWNAGRDTAERRRAREAATLDCQRNGFGGLTCRPQRP